MLPLTLHTPKPLLRIHGKAIIEYIVEALPPDVSEIIVAVRYLGDQIKEFLHTTYPRRKFIFVEGSDKGSAESFLAAKPFVGAHERFFVVNGDDLPTRAEFDACLAHERALLVCESEEPENCGAIVLNADGTLASIKEKSSHPPSHFVVGGILLLTPEIFQYQPRVHEGRSEFFLTSLVEQFAQDYPVAVAYTGACRQFSSPDDLEVAERQIRERTS